MTKTRHQNRLDFYNSLQREVIVAELRRKIYPSKKDKDYYSRVIEKKREKIESISLRNDLYSIFNSIEERCFFEDEVYRYGVPSFLYKNDDQREELEIKDISNYYSIGSTFKFKGGNDGGVITDNTALLYMMGRNGIDENTIGVEIDGEMTLLKDIRRVL